MIEEGFAGGNVIPANFQGSDADLAKVRENVNKSSEVGRTVATDFTGALVSAGLLEIDPQTGKRLDYFEVAAQASSSCAPSTRATARACTSSASPRPSATSATGRAA